MSKFETLLSLNVNDKVEKKKDGKTELTYLSWVYAWSEFKKVYPDALYEVERFENPITGVKLPYLYDENTGYMVFTNVTADNLTYEMWLPVMNNANKAMKSMQYSYMTKYNGEKSVEAASMFDINKTIMRCLVKNLAMFGLGLYIYAGEDIPEDMENPEKSKKSKTKELAKQNIENSTEIIGQQEQEILKKTIGASAWAQAMTAHKGKISFDVYYKLLEKKGEKQ